MIAKGIYVHVTLSSLAAHWRYHEPNDSCLLDHLRLIQLVNSFKLFPAWDDGQRLSYLAALNIQVIDDRADLNAQEAARQRDRDIASGWNGTSHRFDVSASFNRAREGVKQ